jgi:hypothetical protein
MSEDDAEPDFNPLDIQKPEDDAPVNLKDLPTDKTGGPVFYMTPSMQPMVNAAIAALLERSQHTIFQRHHRIARVRIDKGTRVVDKVKPAEDAKAVDKKPGETPEAPKEKVVTPLAYIAPSAPIIEDISDVHTLREYVDNAISFMQFDKRSDDYRRILPPDKVLHGILRRPSWPFPSIRGIIEAPTLRRDGSILDKPGFDDASGLMFVKPAVTFGDVPKDPDISKCKAAWQHLEDVFVDFPFESPEDRVGAIVALLTVIARHAIEGPVPMFPVVSSTPGAGKTLLVHVISNIAKGRDASAIPVCYEDDEERKRLGAIANSGESLILIDNASGTFGNDVLAAAITSTVVGDRTLGVMEMQRTDLHATFFVTGNNILYKGDLGRRVWPISIDAKCERPEERAIKYKHGQDEDFKAYLRVHRGSLVISALTILRGFIVAGRPRAADKPTIGTFGAWDALIRGAALWLGKPDPILLRRRVKEDLDADVQALRAFVGAWFHEFGETETTAPEVATKAKTSAALNDALLEICPQQRSGAIEARAIGKACQRAKARVVTFYGLHDDEERHAKLVSTSKYKHVRLWKLEMV